MADLEIPRSPRGVGTQVPQPFDGELSPSNPTVTPADTRPASAGASSIPEEEPALKSTSHEEHPQLGEILDHMFNAIATLEQKITDLTNESKVLKKQLATAKRGSTGSAHRPATGQLRQDSGHEEEPSFWKRMTGAIGAGFKQLGKYAAPVMIAGAGICIGGLTMLALLSPAGPVVIAGLVMGAIGVAVWTSLGQHEEDRWETEPETYMEQENLETPLPNNGQPVPTDLRRHSSPP